MLRTERKWLYAGLGVFATWLVFYVIKAKVLPEYWLQAEQGQLAKWYPHSGRLLFYFLKFFLPLQWSLFAIAAACLSYFLIPLVYRKLKNAPPLSPAMRRLRLRLAALFIFALPVVVLISLYMRIERMNGKPVEENNLMINDRNDIYSRGNSFGFTDREHTKEKPKGIYRIAVLGDSFIWGDGLPYEKAWSHLLEKKLLAGYDSIEVLHWGQCGWSTLDEFNFFQQHGKGFQIDLLIIGWVDNDPDMGATPQVPLEDPDKEYPVLNKIFPSIAQRMVVNQENEAALTWMRSLYHPENLKAYQQLLIRFHNYLTAQGVRSLVVMTPNPFFDEMKQRFTILEPRISAAGFTCFNLYGPAEKKLGHYTVEQLRANPVNGHPGVLMTEEFATEVKDYLEHNGYLNSLPKKPLAGNSGQQ